MSAENVLRIENAVIATLNLDQLPTEEAILRLVQGFRAMFQVSDDERDIIVRRLHARLRIVMDTGSAVVEKDHQSWLPARRPDIDPYYWQRYEKYLNRNGWPPRVTSTLDRIADEVLDLMGDPSKDGQWKRRGLVMGDVQSGKTATYIALCCKAADAGYRLIILMTGTLENLRRQTQERLDAGFVGLDSAGLLSQQRITREVGVGLLDRRRTAGVFTSKTTDFKSSLMNTLGFRLNSFREPVLVVVKKNKRILENLENWLRSYNADGNGRIDTPMLLIDDEADNASINTNPANSDPTAINERIRALLNLFTRSSYVGFTATPFANIFIDPDSDREMIGDDLFPRHFIYSLESPTNYVGSQIIFGDNAILDILREINDAEEVFPPRHRRNLIIDHLPESLLVALRFFILSNTLRDLRGEGNTHRSMLVNVSRFTDVQDQLAGMLDYELREINREIRNYSQLTPAEASRSVKIAAIRSIWEREFGGAGFEWPDVQRALLRAALPIEVRAVNQRTGAASLDYSAYRDTGLRVVAVGGNSLSRGLTLEGLSTSYFLRNSQMYDTLLQMGRWFGYRDGYADLCRIWLSEEAISWYQHITSATEELRSEIRRMCAINLTPEDFGLKVRAHPDSLIVTARNKMRAARTIERVISVNNRSFETPRLHKSQDINRANKLAAESLLAALAAAGIPNVTSRWTNNIWREVPKDIVCQFLGRFDSHPLNITFQRDSIVEFLERTDEPKLRLWDIVLPNGGEASENISGISYRPQKRRVKADSDTQSVLISGEKMRVGSRGIEKEGIPYEIVQEIEKRYRDENKSKSFPDEIYRVNRLRPLLLVHLLKPFTDDLQEYDTGGIPLVAVGLSFPQFDDTDIARRVRYRINLVEWKNMFQEEVDDDLENIDDAD